MQFTRQNFEQFAVGAACHEFTDDAWRPQRIPRQMRPLYEAAEVSRTRMLCPAGVRLRFVSDTRRLDMRWRCGVCARQIFKGALVVDGGAPVVVGSEVGGEWSGHIHGQPDHVSHTFDLWLPHMAATEVLAVELDDGCRLEAAASLAKRWLVYGDSITQGMQAVRPTDTAFGICARSLDAEVLNLGIGGAKLDPELATTIPDWPCDVISIAYGTNDFNTGRTVAEYRRHAASLLDALEAGHSGTPTLLISPLIWAGRHDRNAAGATLDDFRAAAHDVAQGRRTVTVVPGERLIDDDPTCFVDRPSKV